MPSEWPTRLPYESWSATCDTLHAHTQVLGKLAVVLAPPEPQLQHAALRLTARGWETLPLPAPDGSGALVVALDLRTHEAVAEHSDGRARRVALTPDRPVGEVTRELLEAVARAGGRRSRSTRRRRRCRGPCRSTRTTSTPATTPIRSATYFAAATRAALVLAAFRAPYRGRSTPVNAWWGSFDLAVSLFSGATGRSPVRRLHHAQRDGRAGGRRRLVAGRRALRQGRLLRLRAPGPGGVRGRDALARRRRAGTRRSASTSSTGTTSAPAPIRMRSRSSSRARRSAMPVSVCDWDPGARRPARRVRRRRSTELRLAA